jgi:hypothetical protein
MSSPPLFYVAGASTLPIPAFDLTCAKSEGCAKVRSDCQQRDPPVHWLFYVKLGLLVLVLGMHGVFRGLDFGLHVMLV